MTPEEIGLVLKRFDTPNEVCRMDKGTFEDGTVQELTTGTLFNFLPTPHDSWVVGYEPYVSLQFLGADHYAK